MAEAKVVMEELFIIELSKWIHQSICYWYKKQQDLWVKVYNKDKNHGRLSVAIRKRVIVLVTYAVHKEGRSGVGISTCGEFSWKGLKIIPYKL